MNSAPDTHAIEAGVMTAFLRTGRQIEHGSSVLMLVSVLLFAVGLLTLPETVLVALALIAGIAEKYYGWRVALDAGLFALLAAAPAQTGAFDAALEACLGRTASGAARSLQSRWQGANRLLSRQVVLCALQLLLIIAQIVLIAGAD